MEDDSADRKPCDLAASTQTSGDNAHSTSLNQAIITTANSGASELGNHHLVLTSINGEQYAMALQSNACLPSSSSMGETAFFVTNTPNEEAASSHVTFESGPNQEHDVDSMNVVEVSASSNDIVVTDGSSACLVCGDHGSGYHYSVYSCEGCKGFFKRSVQKNMRYTCKETGLCQINKFTRNSCQHCRFQRCLEVGMRKEAVREDRTPGGKHRVKKIRLEDGEYDGGFVSAMDSSVVAECCMTEEDEILIQQLVDAKPDIIPGPADGSVLDADKIDLNEMMQFAYLELRYIIEWAKQVPGFSSLQIEDQMALLKSSFMDLSVLRLARRSLDCQDTVRFSTTLNMSADQCNRLGWGDELLNSALDFISRLRGIQCDLTEFCILNAIVLTYPDAPGLVNRQSVVALQTKIINLLQIYSTARYGDSAQRYGRILLRLPSLRAVSAKAAEKFLSFSLEGDSQMSSLVMEMIS